MGETKLMSVDRARCLSCREGPFFTSTPGLSRCSDMQRECNGLFRIRRALALAWRELMAHWR